MTIEFILNKFQFEKDQWYDGPFYNARMLVRSYDGVIHFEKHVIGPPARPCCWIAHVMPVIGVYCIRFDIFSDQTIPMGQPFVKLHLPPRWIPVPCHIEANTWTTITLEAKITAENDLLCFFFDEFDNLLSLQFRHIVVEPIRGNLILWGKSAQNRETLNQISSSTSIRPIIVNRGPDGVEDASDDEIFACMQLYNFPFFNHIHRLYYFNMVSFFLNLGKAYKHVLETGQLVAARPIIFCRTDLFVQNSGKLQDFLLHSRIVTTLRRLCDGTIEDRFFIFSDAQDFSLFFHAIESHAVFRHMADMEDPEAIYPEMILLTYFRAHLPHLAESERFQSDMTFTPNFHKYSEEMFRNMIRKYLQAITKHSGTVVPIFLLEKKNTVCSLQNFLDEACLPYTKYFDMYPIFKEEVKSYRLLIRFREKRYIHGPLQRPWARR